jgi:hypothetical protein
MSHWVPALVLGAAIGAAALLVWAMFVLALQAIQ